MKTQTLEYNKQTGKITLNTYTQDEFLETEIDITEQVTTLVLDKLYDEYGLEDGAEFGFQQPQRSDLKIIDKVDESTGERINPYLNFIADAANNMTPQDKSGLRQLD